MAASGKDRPEEIPVLLAKLDEGYDYIQGSRFMQGGASVNLPFARWILIHGFTLMFRILTGFNGSDVTNGFRAYRLSLLDDSRMDIHQEWLDRYELEYYIHWQNMADGSVAGPPQITHRAAFDTMTALTSSAQANLDMFVILEGTLVVGATAGTFAVRAASETANTDVTVRPGSWGTWYEF